MIKGCAEESRIVGIEVVVEPVPVEVGLTVVPDEVEHVEVVVRVRGIRLSCLPKHRPSNSSQS